MSSASTCSSSSSMSSSALSHSNSSKTNCYFAKLPTVLLTHCIEFSDSGYRVMRVNKAFLYSSYEAYIMAKQPYHKHFPCLEQIRKNPHISVEDQPKTIGYIHRFAVSKLRQAGGIVVDPQAIGLHSLMKKTADHCFNAFFDRLLIRLKEVGHIFYDKDREILTNMQKQWKTLKDPEEKARQGRAWMKEHQERLKGLTSILDLNGLGLPVLPPEIGFLKGLKIMLMLQRNNLESLPKEIADLQSLQRIALDRNEFFESLSTQARSFLPEILGFPTLRST